MEDTTNKEDNNNVILERAAVNNNKEAPTVQISEQQSTPNATNQQQHNPTELLNSNTSAEIKQLNKTLTKKPPDILCNCPQKCDQRVPQEVRSSLYKEFCSLGDHLRQNTYLQSFIEMRSVYKRLWSEEERVGGRLQRRVSCKYKIPMQLPNNRLNATELSRSAPRISTNSKGQATIMVGVKEAIRTIEVCQKAFMNVYGITEKRIRLQREKLIARLRADYPERNVHLGAVEDFGAANEYHSSGVSHRHQAEDEDYEDQLSIVDTFFRNQLWKPEYIGISSDKLQYIDTFSNNVKA
ncbi:hypothetical protein O3M35_011244 [Rhynocoris fuscipes]|uniref:Uncharacterized protein n=1 Tax=Rhynocoris fuscipes TaxID=488301 RepID=A0AAW1D297_9HEMI